MRIRLEADGRDEGLERPPSRRGVGGASAPRRPVKPTLNARHVLAIAAPVQRLGADAADQRLRHHGALHRVPVVAGAGERRCRCCTAGSSVFIAPGGIAEVPVLGVAGRVDVAAGAREVPELRRQVRVVEERPAVLDDGRRRVEETHAPDLGVGRRCSTDDTVASKRFRHVEAAPRLVERETGRPCADVDGREPRAVRRVRLDDVVRAHAAHVDGAAVGVHTTPRGSLMPMWRSAGVALVFRYCGLWRVREEVLVQVDDAGDRADVVAGRRSPMRVRRLLRRARFEAVLVRPVACRPASRAGRRVHGDRHVRC